MTSDSPGCCHFDILLSLYWYTLEVVYEYDSSTAYRTLGSVPMAYHRRLQQQYFVEQPVSYWHDYYDTNTFGVGTLRKIALYHAYEYVRCTVLLAVYEYSLLVHMYKYVPGIIHIIPPVV